ncbi:MAG: SDR family NAD(P)-dependent oxidoreductase [Lachnospirales bacterium]
MSKVVFVSGGTKGIGKEIALYFANKGFITIINGYSDIEAFESTVKQLKNINPQNHGYIGDLSKHETTLKILDLVYEKYGKVDVLINNLGKTEFSLFSSSNISNIRTLVDNNLYGYINPTHYITKHMIKEKSGVIINISSVFGEVGASCEVAYSVSKGAINTFTQALAKELAPSNILVNAIALGFCDTNMNSYLSEQEKTELCNDIPLGKSCEPIEVAKLCYYLACENRYITGQIIRQDGGWI